MENPFRKKIKIQTDKERHFQIIDWIEDSSLKNRFNNYKIYATGVTKEGYSLCLVIEDFKPFFYIKRSDQYNQKDFEEEKKYFPIKFKNCLENKGNKDIKFDCKLVQKKDIYGFTNGKLFNFIQFKFYTYHGFCTVLKYFRENKEKLYQSNFDNILKICSKKDFLLTGWYKIEANKYSTFKHRISNCQIEIKISYKNLIRNDQDIISQIRQASFDIEVYSPTGDFPSPELIDCPVITISTVFKKYHEDDFYYKHLITLGKCDHISDEITIESYSSEEEVLLAWKELILQTDPDIIYHYNGDKFDYYYLLERAKILDIEDKFCEMSRIRSIPCTLKKNTFSSSAYGTNEYNRFLIPGRLNCDVLIYIQRGYQLPSYKLNNVSEHFLKMNKVDLSAKELFKTYKKYLETNESKYNKIIGEYCLCEDTRISFQNFSINIKYLNNINYDVISWYDKKGFSTSKIINFFNNGRKNCIEIILFDGSSIKCTKDHKFLTKNGWIEAQNLTFTDKIISYPESPYIEYEKEYSQTFKFTDNLEFDYEKSSIFCRILGYLLTDGCIYENVCYKKYKIEKKYTYIEAKISLGTKIDALNIQKDIFLLINKNPSIIQGKYTYDIKLPTDLIKMFLSIKGIKKGSKILQHSELPEFLKREDCPLWIIREFLKGLMGGDGGTTTYSKKSKKISRISFFQSKTKEYLKSLEEYLKEIQKLFFKFNIRSTLSSITKNKKGNGYTQSLKILLDDTILYYEKIGFAYCIGKKYKLAIVSSYYKLKKETKNQYDWVCNRILELKKKMKIKDAIIQAYKEMIEKGPIYNNHYSSPTLIFNNFTFKKTKRLNLKKKYFPSFENFLNMTETYNNFINYDNKKSYYINKNIEYIPCYFRNMIYKRDIGLQNVYDIEIKNTHNYLANGLVVHNCIQDTILPQLLCDKLLLLPNQIEMSNISHVPISYLFTRGQSIKVFSQMNRLCIKMNYVIPEKKFNILEESFKGATVLVAKKGAYFDNISTLDFASLYPSIIRAYNLCYSSFISDSDYDNIEGIEYKTIEWKEKLIEKKEGKCLASIQSGKNKGQLCGKDIVDGDFCKIHISKELKKNKSYEKSYIKEYKYKFAQNTETILPKLLSDLAIRRKMVKKLMKDEKNSSTYQLLDKRQLAIKVSMNSIYGFLASPKLKLKEIAACVTAIGREMIEKSKDYVENDFMEYIEDNNIIDYPMYMEVIYGDSIPKDEPILIRNSLSNEIFVKEIGELNKNEDKWKEYKNEKEQCYLPYLETWSTNGWTKILRLIRHKNKPPIKKLYKITISNNSTVVCTEDHSLLTDKCEIIKPKDLIENQTRLLVSNMNL
jgi:DNA polymerase elongation subunit (family B)/intein/homing endonuclease